MIENRSVGRTICNVLGTLVLSAATIATFANVGIDAKESGDYVAATMFAGPPLTVISGLIVAGAHKAIEYTTRPAYDP